MNRIQLLYRKSHKYDAIRAPFIMFFAIFIIYLIIELLSNWLFLRGFLKYGFSGNGWGFVFVWGFLIFTYVFFYIGCKLSQVDKEEYLYLEGDQLVYLHGKTNKRVKIKDIDEMIIGASGIQRVLHFKTRNPRDEIRFGAEYSLSLRSWISVNELMKKGMEIYNTLRKINPNIELKRVVPRKYRANKNAVMEIYEDGRWKPYRIKPWWET